MMPLQRHIKNVVRNYTEAERKVREATSNDPWGPSSTLMSEIADRTYNVIAFTEIMQMIWRRLNDKSKNWRHVYKALILLDYIIKTGSDKVAIQCRENIHAIETLMDFYYVEEGKDVGNSVREKARSLNALLRDDERLQEERTKALLARERLMHGGALGTSGPSAYSPPSMAGFGRSASSYGDERRPSSQPSFSGVGESCEFPHIFASGASLHCHVSCTLHVFAVSSERSTASSSSSSLICSKPRHTNSIRIHLFALKVLGTRLKFGPGREVLDFDRNQTFLAVISIFTLRTSHIRFLRILGGISSELDSAQPQSYTEEQLQLQLALAISKEEHERELQKRHEEEAKEALKLQMVLEQSKREEQVRARSLSLFQLFIFLEVPCFHYPLHSIEFGSSRHELSTIYSCVSSQHSSLKLEL
ncbi:unnamed protein product [Rodentolepis nana]|uniref:ENTH domain-containing protein n=1 Tax=Rodentolepis nana TaxID=102285 RepID=A0A0R3T5G9_RODNA|nr:unnamed protein product [Rodentolepis nana]